MSTPLPDPRLAGTRPSPWWMSRLLIVLLFHAACATGHPPDGRQSAEGARQASPTPPPAPKLAGTPAPEPGVTAAVVYDVEVLEPGAVATRPVPIGKAELQRALRRLAHRMQLKGTPQEAARQLLQLPLEEEWLAEVYRGRVLTLAPLNDTSALVPEAEAALRAKYLNWCEKRGGGDCLGLFDDGPYLRTDDRRTLALALAFGSVLDETYEALGRELNPRALVASLVWASGMYLALWLVPEPSTKALAAALTVVLVGWLGVDTAWGLMDGWAHLATQAHEATTFEELRTAGEGFARVLGTDAARTMILAVGALTGRTLGEVAARVRLLPGHALAMAQWEAQGFRVPMAVAVEQVAVVETVVASSERTLAVLMRPQGPLSGAMMSQNSAAGAALAPGQGSVTIAIRHRGGNQQVILPNGQRWHLPRGKSLEDIPAKDKLGDELQAAADRLAKQWGQHRLSDAEKKVIDAARKKGNDRSAAHLEGLARGRWMHAQLKNEFKHLTWNHRSVDVVEPRPGGLQYEVLSGTAENFGVHGRRMAGEFFRMIFF